MLVVGCKLEAGKRGNSAPFVSTLAGVDDGLGKIRKVVIDGWGSEDGEGDGRTEDRDVMEDEREVSGNCGAGDELE